MVVISNCKNMFWGVTIDAGKRYSQVVSQGFHVSMAALDISTKKASGPVQVMLQHESSDYLLCSLTESTFQQALDLNFALGEQVSFSLNGNGVVHLTGYLIPDDDDLGEQSFTDSEDEAPDLVDMAGDNRKRKIEVPLKKSKKLKLLDSSVTEEDDSDEDDPDYDSEEEEGFSDDFGEDSYFDEEASEEDSDFDEDEEEEDMEESDTSPVKPGKKGSTTPAKSPKVETPVSKKKNKKDGQTPKQETKTPKEGSKTPSQDGKSPKKESKSPVAGGASPKKGKQEAAETPSTPVNGESAKKKKKKKKKKKDGDNSMNDSTVSTPGLTLKTPPGGGNTPKTENTPKKRVVAGGTVVEDLKVGHGPDAKPGKMVSVYYVGTLAKSNKRFDSCTDGKPFRFRLNQGEVIKGWDNGVAGMKVGGKRRITVPANQGYGNAKQGPIPPNSTLVFEVELKAVS